MTICLPHRSASGRLDGACWEFDESRSAVIVCSAGPARVDVDIPVASQHAPRFSSFAIVRKAADIWQIAPSRFTRRVDGGPWTVIAAPYDEHGRLYDFLVLTNAPERAIADMERL